MNTRYPLSRTEYERDVDITLAGSFPASDPPSWTLGASPWMGFETAAIRTPVPAAVDVVFEDRRSVSGIPLASIGEVFLLVSTVPLGILIVGVPIVALVWWMAGAATWLIGGG